MKLFHIISSAILGTTVAVGVGLAIAQNQNRVQEAKADTQVVDFTLTSASSVSKSGVTVEYAQNGATNAPTWYDKGLRLYANNTITISSSKSITAISFNWEKQGSKAFATASASTGNYTHPSTTGTGSWSGSANSVVFTLGSSGQLQLNTFSVTVDSSGGGSITNPIADLYSKSNNDPVSSIYGYYVGKLDDNNIVIMDGDYGIDVYKAGEFSSISYVENETIIVVSGKINIYNGLYEISATSVSTAASASISAPVVYTAKGGETKEYQNRVTTVTGVPSVTSGSLDNAAGTSDIKMNFSVNSKTVYIHYKKARQTSEAIGKLKTAVSGGNEITISGFTGWYKKTDSDPGFQVQMVDVVPEDTSYTAEIFAQDLLDQTDAVCDGWTEGTNNHDALVAIWSDLASADKYPKLPSEQKTLLAEADVEGSSTIDRAMARYDFLTHKYGLNNFINGRLPSSSRYIPLINNSNTTIIIVIISVISISALSFGLFLAIRKRKHN